MSSKRKTPFVYSNKALCPRVGDRVRFLREVEILVVEEVIDSDGKQRRWNVDEHGLMLKGGSYGLVFTKDINTDLELVTQKGEE